MNTRHNEIGYAHRKIRLPTDSIAYGVSGLSSLELAVLDAWCEKCPV